MALEMLVFVQILANEAVEYDIRQSLEREAFKNLEEITSNQAGNIIYKKDFVQEEGDIHFLVLDEQGNVLRGQYPKGFPEDITFSYTHMTLPTTPYLYI